MTLPPIVVQAVGRRAPMVEYLEHHLPITRICWDDHNDPMGTFFQSLTCHDEGHFHFEDDVTLTDNFTEQAIRYIGDGSRPVQFFSRVKDDLTKGTRLRPGASFMYAMAVYIPAGIGQQIVNFHPQWDDRIKHPTGFDLLIGAYFKQNNIRYLNVVPSLVQHTSIPSTLGTRSTARTSPTFTNPNLNHHPYPKSVQTHQP